MTNPFRKEAFVVQPARGERQRATQRRHSRPRRASWPSRGGHPERSDPDRPKSGSSRGGQSAARRAERSEPRSGALDAREAIRSPFRTSREPPTPRATARRRPTCADQDEPTVLDPADQRWVAGVQRRSKRVGRTRQSDDGPGSSRRGTRRHPRGRVNDDRAGNERGERRGPRPSISASRAASPAPESPPARRGACAASLPGRRARACRSAAPAPAGAAAPSRSAEARPTKSPACGPPSSLSPENTTSAAPASTERRTTRFVPQRRQRARADVVHHGHAELAQLLDRDASTKPTWAKLQRCTRRIAPTSSFRARS